ncbi:MAG: UDP-N-acetylmuramate dehydrogenase [Rikenellaceae bacterium]|nr:UDP-N-acetylmuramate dehydrogenase [Rikenellaceae bacterium]
MIIRDNADMRGYTTFGVEASAERLVEYDGLGDLRDYFASHPVSEGYYVIGGGSNILFRGDYRGTLLHPVYDKNGFGVRREGDGVVYVRADAGFDWDDLVGMCVDNGWFGLENLSAIPGTAGASAVQNIGAYGAEAKDFIESVEVYNPFEDECFTMRGDECEFGYRDSVFKRRRELIVTAVTYRLSETFVPSLGYADLKARVEAEGEPTASSVRSVIKRVRASKLPDPKEIGSGGSFFKNPVVDVALADGLSVRYPSMPRYDVDGGVKIPAGWLIDTAGWKGYRCGDAGVYDKQALVLVNYGSADGEQVVELAGRITADVRNKFGIDLKPEIIIL